LPLRSRRRKGVTELITAMLLIAMTLVAGFAVFGYVRLQANVSELSYAQSVGGTMSYLQERFVVRAGGIHRDRGHGLHLHERTDCDPVRADRGLRPDEGEPGRHVRRELRHGEQPRAVQGTDCGTRRTRTPCSARGPASSQ